MMLLSDGTVMAQNGDPNTPANRNQWYRLTPTSSGSYASGTWSNLASMSLPRLYDGSNVLPDGQVLVVGGEYTTSNTAVLTNTGEIYNPVTNSWSSIANFPQSQFGDDPTQLLPDGRVLAGYVNGGQTYIYNPSTNSWSATGSKQRTDPSDEETWVKLPDDSILSYDVWTEGQGGTNHAQRYVPSSGTWVDAGNVPTALSGGSAYGYELGGAERLPDGRMWVLGANSHTAFYNPSNNSWTAGPSIPTNGSGQLQGADDAPVAMLPDGKVLLAVDHPVFNGPTNVYEFDPSNDSFTNVTPSISGLSTSGACYQDRMLVLPNGQVLFTTGGNRLAVYTPAGSPSASWRSTVSSISGSGTTMTLSGTQLNGISQGASYGDDAEMDTNYPLVQYRVPGSSNVAYARTANWSSTGVANGSETVTFTVPSRGIYLVNAIANGIASPTVLSVQMRTAIDGHNLLIRNNPNNSADVQVVSGSTVLAEVALSSISKLLVNSAGGENTLTVSYQYGNPLPGSGLDYEYAGGFDTLIVNDQTTTTNQTFTFGYGRVQRSGSAPITFTAPADIFPIVSLTINGGSGNNTYTVSETGNLSYAGTRTNTINTGNGNDTVNVEATEGPLTVNLGSGTDWVNVSPAANNLDNIQGNVTVHGGTGFDTLQVFDDHHPTGRTYTVTASTITRGGAAVITFGSLAINSVVLSGGGGANVFNVLDTEPGFATTVDANSATDMVNVRGTTGVLTVNVFGGFAGSPQVNVGDAGSLQNIRGAVMVATDRFSTARLAVDDSADATGRTVALGINGSTSTGTITGLTASGAVITFPQFTLAALTVSGGGGANTYMVNNTGTGFPTTLNTGSGNETVNVEATTGSLTVNGGAGGSTFNLSPTAHNLANLAGLVHINGQGGSNTLNAYDQATTFSQDFASDDLYQDHLDRYDPTVRTVFTYAGMQSINVSTGRGDNGAESFGVISTPAGVPVTITNAGTSPFYVQCIVGYPLAAIQGPLTIHGRPGGTDFLEVSDATDPNPQTFMVTASAVSRAGAAPIVFDNQTGLVLGTSEQAPATVTVQSTAAGAFTQIGLSAGDQATVSAPSIQGGLRLVSGGAVSVTVDDSGDGMPRTATLATDPTFRYALNGLAPQVIYLDLDPGSSMAVLGGSGGNTFDVQGLLSGATLNLDGGSGTNTLDYTGYTGSVVVDLQTGVATGFSSIANIENVTGASSGGDQGFYNLLIGNGGNTLTGGFGRRNILVAGGTASTLNAGDGEDLLIGGSTIYDTDPSLASWLQIAAYWVGTDDYFTRAANLTTGNGVPLLDATTVTGNGGGNTMNGNGALALIYSDGADNITGFDPNSIIVPITP
jgi:hypothetical protein